MTVNKEIRQYFRRLESTCGTFDKLGFMLVDTQARRGIFSVLEKLICRKRFKSTFLSIYNSLVSFTYNICQIQLTSML